MASNYRQAEVYLEKMEGGYCSGGVSCGDKANNIRSGETYRGVDRKAQKNQPAAMWTAIDAHKAKYGPIKNQGFITSEFAPVINSEVAKFYESWWKNTGMANINNPILAGMIHAFLVNAGPTGGMKIINPVAKKLGAKATKSNAVTPDVAAALERNLSAGYAAVRQAIINFYPKGDIRVKNRVLVFPTTIAPGTSTGTNTAGTGGGLLGALAALFGAFKIL